MEKVGREEGNGKDERASKEKEIEQAFMELRNDAHMNGLHLKYRPFIPEDCGFVESKITDSNEKVRAVVFSKDGFNITRPINSEIEEWTVLTPDALGGQKVSGKFNNMHDALVVLSFLGMKEMNPMDYVKRSMEEEF
jgi:hypothetical protein